VTRKRKLKDFLGKLPTFWADFLGKAPHYLQTLEATHQCRRRSWRFAYDETKERSEVLRVMRMLKDGGEPQKRKRVYVLIGNEPVADCLRRVQEVIDNGCEPHCQPLLRLNCLQRHPWIRFDWTEDTLRNMARWANKWIWKQTSFANYDRHFRRHRAAHNRSDDRQPILAIN